MWRIVLDRPRLPSGSCFQLGESRCRICRRGGHDAKGFAECRPRTPDVSWRDLKSFGPVAAGRLCRVIGHRMGAERLRRISCRGWVVNGQVRYRRHGGQLGA